MSVHRAKGGKWEVRWREGRRQRARTFDRRTDAARYDVEVRRRRQLGEQVLRPQDVPTFEEFARQWFDRRRASGVARNTLLFDAGLLDNYLLPDLGHLSLLDLRPRRLDQWQHQILEARESAYMTQRAIALLGRILDRAVALEYLVGNPVRALERPSHRRRRGRTATAAQIEMIRGWFLEREDLGAATLVSLLAYGGLRPTEALGLEWRDLRGRRLHAAARHNVDGELLPGTKTGEERARWIELPGPLVADLAAWRLVVGRPEGLIFPRAADQLPWRKYDWGNWRRRRFDFAAGAAGLRKWDARHRRWQPQPAFPPYFLRHTCASLMIAAGRPIAEVADHLGHGVDVCSRTYAHAIEAMKGEPVRTVDELIREARGEADPDSDVRTGFGG